MGAFRSIPSGLTRPQAETPKYNRPGFGETYLRLTRPQAVTPPSTSGSTRQGMVYPPAGGDTDTASQVRVTVLGIPARRRRHPTGPSIAITLTRHTRPQAETPQRRTHLQNSHSAYPPAGGDTVNEKVMHYPGSGIPARRRRHPYFRPREHILMRHSRPQAETAQEQNMVKPEIMVYPPVGGDTGMQMRFLL